MADTQRMEASDPNDLAVRPVTARTWQALASEEGFGHQIGQAVWRTNDLFHGFEGDATPTTHSAAHATPPLYQPTSARPGTPTPKFGEQPPPQRQQHIIIPSRLFSTGAAPAGGRSQVRINGVGSGASGGPQTADVLSIDRQAATGAGSAAGVSAATDTNSGSTQQPRQWQRQQHLDVAARPTTAPARPAGLPLRTSIVSIPYLQQSPGRQSLTPRPGTAQGSTGTDNSPRTLPNFAGAVTSRSGDMGPGSRPLTGGPRFSLPGKLSADPGSSNRPSTPSFQPVALSRSATAQPTAAAASSSDSSQFNIKAAHRPAGLSGFGSEGPAGAYPQPPSTAPLLQSGFQGAVPAALQQQQQAGSLASFGISAAAFVAVPPKLAKADVTADGQSLADSKAALPAPTQAALLATASLSSKADLRRFLLTPGPADKPLCCKIVRSSGGLLKSSQQYTLLVEQDSGKTGTFLAAARKRKGGPSGVTYVLSVDQHDISRHSASYVGKLRSNFLGTEFAIHDAGSKTGKDGPAQCELGAALYQTNVLGTKGPRKMTVLIPKLDAGGHRPLPLSPKGEGDTLLGQYKAYNLSSCVVLRNKPPRWNQSLGAYCLNFAGRVTQASVKNFQLVSVDNMERTILQFGKVADDVFTMDFSYPMTALQAFAICLSSFASKLATQ